MKLNKNISIWWGPPKDFDTKEQDRRVSWLELFYDLVYVIAIAHITHHLSNNLNLRGVLEYICLFILIFWGWLNGSFHHDLHGNLGLRTRLMTLWQMIIIAALAVVLDKHHIDYSEITIVFMIMQLYITYQWWSVGIYDKSHRKYNWPYTILYLVSLGFMGVSLFVSEYWLRFMIPMILLCNYVPPYIANELLTRSSKRLDLSSSMFERLGLFTIIIFGELVIGVVKGIGKLEGIGFSDWLNFALGVTLVFTLWWIFFVFVSQRKVKNGFNKASTLELLYIPALISLGFIAATFVSLFTEPNHMNELQKLLGISVAIFLICICLIMELLVYPNIFDTIKRPMQMSILVTAITFVVLSLIDLQLSVTPYLVITELLLIIEIAFLNYKYYTKLLKVGIDPSEV